MSEAARLGAPWPGAVAVSGGGDSVALMVLLSDWAKARKARAPVVLTVDHGLQEHSAGDARSVTARARALGLKAHALHRRGAKPESDIEAQARAARYALMGAWCREQEIAGLYLAHTLEDQAETFLLRLARGSGIDGLSAMKTVAPLPSRDCEGIVLVRPLLGMRRERLRDFLRARGERWVEDPMNADLRFARARVRAAWPALDSIGLSPARIAAAARHLGRAREVLDRATQQVLAEGCRFEEGAVFFDSARFAAAPSETGLRALSSVLMAVSGREYRPRFERLLGLYEAVCRSGLKGGRTLHGCRIAPAGKRVACFGPGTLCVTSEKSRGAKRGGRRESPEKSLQN
ncbi:MAG TPA: tRNA lysidine(34) synthetase TilS [Rhizomicrobium sp.]